MLLAYFLAELNDTPSAQLTTRAAQMLNCQLADGLLERAAEEGAAPSERGAILRYLSAVLRSQEGAEELLSQPGAAPRLLHLAHASPGLQQQLLGVLERVSVPGDVQIGDVEGVLAFLSTQRAHWRAAQPAGSASQQPLLLGLRLLLAWARASRLNASRLADAGAGAVLAELAAASAVGSGVDGLQQAITQVPGVRLLCHVLSAMPRPGCGMPGSVRPLVGCRQRKLGICPCRCG
jgi:hypothetical protein